MGVLKIYGDFSDSAQWLLIVTVLTLFFYIIVIKPFQYWNKKGVKTSRILPIVGDALFCMAYGKVPFGKLIEQIYKEAGNLRYIGYYQFQKPLLMIRSTELIKQLFVKDADYFLDRYTTFPDSADEIISKTLIYLKGQEWKDARAIWNSFLTASQVEKMFPLMKESVECFLQNFQDNEEKVIEIELKKTANAFIATSSASTYFGIDICSLKKLKDFLLTLGGMFTFGQGILHDFNYLIYAYAPVIAPLFGISSIIKKDAKQYFIKTLEDGLTRENNDIHRPDLIGLWIQKQKEEYDESFGENMKKKKTDLNRLNIVSQLCMFLLNSLDGSVTVLNFALYELAMNPDVQKKLIEEIDEINSQEIEPSYNIISGLQYMDMVISETMRKWPAIIVMERRCTKPYTINAKLPDEVPIHLDVGDIIIAPLYAIQMDPEYFPDPEKFDPERFSPSNRNDIKPYTYLPWGAGPRNCNGGKFALAQLKLFIFQLLSNFELVATESTPKNIKLLKKPGKLEPEEPVIVGLKRRKF